MAKEKQEENKLLGILTGIGRYIFGFIIMISPLIVTLLTGNNPKIILLGLFTPPITLIIAPQILIGLYFMFTGKTRIRVDVTLLILVIICTMALSGFKPTGV
jgi:hypothetical protein